MMTTTFVLGILNLIETMKGNLESLFTPNYQKRGLGKAILDRAKLNNDKLSAWVVDSNSFNKSDEGQYRSPLNFYLKNGFRKEPIRWDSEKIKPVKISWHK